MRETLLQRALVLIQALIKHGACRDVVPVFFWTSCESDYRVSF